MVRPEILSSLTRLLKMQHYGRAKWLKIISLIQFYCLLILLFCPFYSDTLVNKISSILQIERKEILPGFIFSISLVISVLSAISLTREHLLSKTQIVDIDFKKELIRQLFNLLIDNYGWKGTCRVTLFIPSNDVIKIYDRIRSGRGVGGFSSRTFFRMGQGIPGRAWQNAWSGEELNQLIEALQIGNVPDSVLADKHELRKFFKEIFVVADDDIYDSLGPAKSTIRSYMAVGILGKNQELICILVIDSGEEGKFASFELLKDTIQKGGKISITETGLIIGEGKGEDLPIPQQLVLTCINQSNIF